MLANLKKELKSLLDKKRYEHSISVSYISVALAMRYDADIRKAEVAGLLHDCAKGLSDTVIFKKCEKYNITINEYERYNPSILHPKLGAYMTMDKFNIDDKEIISAILNHTTGNADMDLLDKIIFVADYIEPRRHKAANLNEIRKIAFLDIDEAVFMILRDTVSYLETTNKEIDTRSHSALEFYEKIHNQKKMENI